MSSWTCSAGTGRGAGEAHTGIPKEVRDAKIDDRDLGRIEAIISSMARTEHNVSSLIDGSRRLRMANGAGVTTVELSRLIKQFREVQQMLPQMGLAGRVVMRMAKKGAKARKGGGRVTPKGTRSR